MSVTKLKRFKSSGREGFSESRGGKAIDMKRLSKGKGVSESRRGRVLGTSVVTLHAQALSRYTPNKCHAKILVEEGEGG